MNVRALPRCNAPVGDGARRVVGVDTVQYPSGMADSKAKTTPLRLAVLLSGGGRTMQNLADRIKAGSLPASLAVVISSRADAYGLERAKSLGVVAHVVARQDFGSAAAASGRVFELVRQAGADLVCLAGYMSLLMIPDDFAEKVINIHPALLPSFGGKGMYGHRVHEAVLAAGCKVAGCTVHYCDQTYDTGPIIVQRACPVLDDDTPDALATRVFEQECIAYPEAIGLIAQGRVRVEGARARVLPPG